jgi:hypothetical protein
MHLDGGIDSETYHSKLEEYKKRQREITSEMQAHVNADETCIITAKTVLDLAKRAKELFMSSKLGEKQQLLNFVFSNFQLEGKRLLVTLREPFLTLSTMPHQPVSLWVRGFEPPTPCTPCKCASQAALHPDIKRLECLQIDIQLF